MTVFEWFWRGLLLIILLVCGYRFSLGWVRLNKAESGSLARWQLGTFCAGLALIGLLFISPLETFANRYFSVRVIQHILLTGIVPLLLLVSDPFVAWQSEWHISARTRRIVTVLTSPGLVWGAFVAVFWLWYDPFLINAANQYGWVRLLEVVSLLATSSLYWWHIAAAQPRLHRPMPSVVRVIYAFGGMLPIKFLGLALLIGEETLLVRDSAEILITFGNFSMADKTLGALLIWLVGGATYTYTATFLAGRWISIEEIKPERPTNVLLEEETWVAPGIRQ